MEVSGTTRVFALLGHPVARSLSPKLHNRMLADAGVDGVYVALDVAPEAAGGVVGAIRTLGLAGVNLTVPFKEAVIGALDEVDAATAAIGAANTVVRDGSRLVGANTDAPGLVGALEDGFPGVWRGARVLVIGAGGAGRAAVWGALDAGASSVTLLNRNEARALAVAAGRAAVAVGPLTQEAWVAHAPRHDVVLVCASGDGASVGAGWSAELLPRDAVVCDVNYWHPAPPLLGAARAAGRRTQDGLPMLVWQAALAFRLFTGEAADARALLRWLRSA